MSYRSELIKSMKYLSKNKKVIFLGQSVNYSGNAIYNTLKDSSARKKIELPVFEDTQMGISTGLALNGFVPVTCYPRFDFLILSLNQLVNHLDKIREMSLGKLNAKVIIRTSIGAKKPLDGGSQHTQDHTIALKKMLQNVEVIKLKHTKQIFKAYKKALDRKDNKSTLLVEYGDFYNKP